MYINIFIYYLQIATHACAGTTIFNFEFGTIREEEEEEEEEEDL